MMSKVAEMLKGASDKEREGFLTTAARADVLAELTKMQEASDAEDKIVRDEMDIEMAERTRKQIAAAISAELSKTTSKEMFAREYQTEPFDYDVVQPKVKLYKFVSRLGWAWEVENSCGSDEINDLLQTHKKPQSLAFKMCKKLFQEVAERAAKSGEDDYIDEDGTNLTLPDVPYSPYTDEGAAFFCALAYNWRGMAEEWNAQQADRRKEKAARRDAEMAEIGKQLDVNLQKALMNQLKGRDDKVDALTTGVFRPELLGSMIVSTPSSKGIDKIAAALARGELKKRDY